MLQGRTVSVSCLFDRPRSCSLPGSWGAAAWGFNTAVITKISGTCPDLSQAQFLPMSLSCLIAISFFLLMAVFKHRMYKNIQYLRLLEVSHFIFPLIHKVLGPSGQNTKQQQLFPFKQGQHSHLDQTEEFRLLVDTSPVNFALHSSMIFLSKVFREACLASVCNEMETVTYCKCWVLSPQQSWMVFCFESSSLCRAFCQLFVPFS